TAPFAAAAVVPSTHSRIKAVAVAAVVLAVLVGGAAMWRFSNAPQVRRVGVVPFENLTGDSSLSVVGRIAAEELSRSIMQTDSVDVVSSAAVSAAIGAGGQGSGDVVKRMAKATGASVVVI